MKKAHKIRLNPTPSQKQYFRQACGTARFVFNYGLDHWRQHKADYPGVPHGPMAIKKELNAIKHEQFPWMLDVSKCVPEYALRDLATALKNYFDWKSGKRKGARVGFPRFKRKRSRKQSFGLSNDQFKVDGHSFRVPKLGWVNMAEELRLDGKIMSARVSKSADWWYVSIVVEVDNPEPLDFPHESVGVDLGLKTLAVLSSGREFENQKLLRSELNRLKRLNRELARRHKGSSRWYRTQRKLARFHKRVKDRRSDIIHKMTAEIASTYRLIGIEDLNVKGMIKNHCLSLSLTDASFGEIRRQLEYKSSWYGGRVVKVGRFFPSSKTCSDCGHVNRELRLSDRQWACAGCGVLHNRDWNASKNIEAEALRLTVVATSSE